MHRLRNTNITSLSGIHSSSFFWGPARARVTGKHGRQRNRCWFATEDAGLTRQLDSQRQGSPVGCAWGAYRLGRVAALKGCVSDVSRPHTAAWICRLVLAPVVLSVGFAESTPAGGHEC